MKRIIYKLLLKYMLYHDLAPFGNLRNLLDF